MVDPTAPLISSPPSVDHIGAIDATGRAVAGWAPEAQMVFAAFFALGMSAALGFVLYSRFGGRRHPETPAPPAAPTPSPAPSSEAFASFNAALVEIGTNLQVMVAHIERAAEDQRETVGEVRTLTKEVRDLVSNVRGIAAEMRTLAAEMRAGARAMVRTAAE